MTRSTPSRPHRCLFALPCSFTVAEKDPGGRCCRFLLDSGADFGACSAQGLGHLVIQLCGARICFDMVDGNESGVTCMTSARGIMPHVPVSLCCSVHRSRARSSSSAVDKFSQRRFVEIHESLTSLPPSVLHTTTDPPSYKFICVRERSLRTIQIIAPIKSSCTSADLYARTSASSK